MQKEDGAASHPLRSVVDMFLQLVQAHGPHPGSRAPSIGHTDSGLDACLPRRLVEVERTGQKDHQGVRVRRPSRKNRRARAGPGNAPVWRGDNGGATGSTASPDAIRATHAEKNAQFIGSIGTKHVRIKILENS